MATQVYVVADPGGTRAHLRRVSNSKLGCDADPKGMRKRVFRLNNSPAPKYCQACVTAIPDAEIELTPYSRVRKG